jgi:hypothetical protein
MRLTDFSSSRTQWHKHNKFPAQNGTRFHRTNQPETRHTRYDLCYCLDYFPDGITTLAGEWKQRQREPDVAIAVTTLREKFADVNAFGPQQLVEFHSTADRDEADRHRRRAFELVRKLLALYDQA